MQIQVNKAGELELKTKSAAIVFNEAVRVNGIELEGAGEYEIGGISVEGIDEGIYLFQLEDIVVGSANFKGKISKEDLERLSSAEVLVVRLDGSISEAVEQANQTDPQIIIYAGSPSARESVKASGVALEGDSSLKIVKSDLQNKRAYFIEVSNGKETA